MFLTNILTLTLVSALCPFMSGTGGGSLPNSHPPVPSYPHQPIPPRGWIEALNALDMDAVKKDLQEMFKTSQDFWPSDYGNYAPFFVRLAWHNTGSYRTSDGRGGADGGRQRFDPERSWDDNTNLDKARHLLWPIKEKYGSGLSWGDLIVFAGNTAVESMGGPVLGFCAGRIDDPDGFWSEELGPTELQMAREPCPVNGQCMEPLGSTTIGLIYLNPEGPMSQPLPEASSLEVRDAFDRMNMNDSETVALIGGGHAFGKTHGACPNGPGLPPIDDPVNPWPGLCGTGKGADAFTAGFEGPWTTKPTSWDNEYFHNLLNHTWEHWVGPGGRNQWRVTPISDNPVGPGPQGGSEKTMMLTSDVSLLYDPTGKYQELIKTFADEPATFDNAFKHAWYKLTTRDMGPVTRCVGNNIPPVQPFQYPLPMAPAVLADFSLVKEDLVKAIAPSSTSTVVAPNYGAFFVRLAWQCAKTFRVTDYLGGCNGARIRFSPQKDWPENAGLDAALKLLEPVKAKYGDKLSWADLIVLAGNTGIEMAGGRTMKFCGGRTDAVEGSGSQYLEPRITGDWTDTTDLLKQTLLLLGLTNREMIVLMGGGHSIGSMHEDRTGFTGQWTKDTTKISNDYFENLLSEDWEKYTVSGSKKVQYKAKTADLYMLKTDLLLKYDAAFLAIAQDFASDNDQFLDEFALAWTKVMNADRFDGPVGNVCDCHCGSKPCNKASMLEKLII